MHEERGPAPAAPPAETILALDNVALALPIAGAGSRVLAGFVDYLLQAVLQVLWLLAFFAFGIVSGFAEGWGIVVYLFGALLMDWVYFAGTEALWGGQTPGKRFLGLRTVARDGGRAEKGSIVLRNLLRPIDLIVGVPMIALDPLARRLGDRVAGTVVVHDRGVERGIFLRRIPPGWGPADVAIVEALFARERELQAGRADELARGVLAWLERDAPALLEGIDRSLPPLEIVRRAFGVEIR